MHQVQDRNWLYSERQNWEKGRERERMNELFFYLDNTWFDNVNMFVMPIKPFWIELNSTELREMSHLVVYDARQQVTTGPKGVPSSPWFRCWSWYSNLLSKHEQLAWLYLHVCALHMTTCCVFETAGHPAGTQLHHSDRGGAAKDEQQETSKRRNIRGQGYFQLLLRHHTHH